MAQVCTRCVMSDEADPNIRFDSEGRCNYCTAALKLQPQVYFPNETGQAKIEAMVETLKQAGHGKPYDCLMGISGGLDSAYLAYLGAAEWGLRIAAVHIDDGFDTEVSRRNIQRLAQACGIQLEIITPDPYQFNELARAYMLAGVPNLAVPQDNVLTTCLYRYAKENGLSYFLSGTNFALECILQSGNTHDAFDLVNLRDIHRRFGRAGIDKLPMMSQWGRYMDRWRMKVREYRPLDWVDYNANAAMARLQSFCGFEYYGSKHLENTFTAFLQLYWLPRKFGVDKRRSHLSSMVVSGQLPRNEALARLQAPMADESFMQQVLASIKKELDFSDAEFDALMATPPHQHADYKTDKLFKSIIKAYLALTGK